jgi:hypothetical protein
MKISICWSGTWGKKAADEIRDWLCHEVLGGVLQASDVRVSEDIAKGAVRFEQLRDFLDEASAALVCLTRDALRSALGSLRGRRYAQTLGDKRSSANGCSRLAPILPIINSPILARAKVSSRSSGSARLFSPRVPELLANMTERGILNGGRVHVGSRRDLRVASAARRL